MRPSPPLTLIDQWRSIMSNRIYPNKTCPVCGDPVRRSSYTFCSRDCYRPHPTTRLSDWLAGGSGVQQDGVLFKVVRDYILQKHNNRCEICGWGELNPNTNKVPVQIHHKDGNSKNNKEENLQVLCPNCHSLTPTFGGANKGNGRKSRYH